LVHIYDQQINDIYCVTGENLKNCFAVEIFQKARVNDLITALSLSYNSKMLIVKTANVGGS
jgi:hypothetical protein